MLGYKTRAYSEIEENCKALTDGLVIAIDPSIGSSSSLPGYAVYRAGELIASGTFSIPHNRSIPERLGILHGHVRKLYNEYTPDVVVYEDVPAQRHGGSVVAHASLLKALGAILSVPGPDGYVGLMPVSWKAEARDTYVKGDKEDAVEIGYVAIQVARRIRDDVKGKKHGKSQ